MPFDFARLPLAAALAYLLFGQLPDLWTIAGAAVIFLATLYVTLRERRLSGNGDLKRYIWERESTLLIGARCRALSTGDERVFPLKDDISSHRPPIVTVGLITTCVLIFFWQASLGARAAAYAVYSYGFIPAVLFGDAELPADLAVLPATATLFTSMFLHGGMMHLAGNMLYLWVFGNNIEDNLGHVRFLLFYLLCGVAAAFAQALPDPTSEIPMIGASGAISGVLGAYLVLYPHARVHVIIPFGFLFLHTIRAGWLLGLWFVFQVLSGLFGPSDGGGVAWWAHVGGFVAGMALILVMRDRRRRLWRGPPSRGRSYLPGVSRRRPGPWG